jgi:outer membrane protein assembly factor BamB
MRSRRVLLSVGTISALALLFAILLYFREKEVGSRSTQVDTAFSMSTPTPVLGSPPSSDGSMDRANVHGTGVYVTKGVPQLTGLKWKSKINDGFVDTAAVAQGHSVYFGAGGHLYAIDTETGAERWNFKADNIATTAPAVADGSVYVGAWETFYALNPETGDVRWIFRPEAGAHDSPYASPMVNDGIIYFGGRGKFYALDSKTGQERWKFALSGRVKSTPIVYDGTVYFGSNSPDGREATYFYALDSKTGQEKWKLRTTGNGVVGSAAATDGLVYVGTWDDGLLALEAKSGKEKWRFNPDSGVLTAPAVAYETVYIVVRTTLYALHGTTGQEKWRFASGDRGLYSDAVVADGIVYFITTSAGFGFIINLTEPAGHLYAINAQRGQEHWAFSVSYMTSRTPMIADGVIYFGAEDGHVYAVH